jgi:hypothetical protein
MRAEFHLDTHVMLHFVHLQCVPLGFGATVSGCSLSLSPGGRQKALRRHNTRRRWRLITAATGLLAAPPTGHFMSCYVARLVDSTRRRRG